MSQIAGRRGGEPTGAGKLNPLGSYLVLFLSEAPAAPAPPLGAFASPTWVCLVREAFCSVYSP